MAPKRKFISPIEYYNVLGILHILPGYHVYPTHFCMLKSLA